MSENPSNELAVTTSEDFSEMKGKYLTFWTDGQLFAIPISDVVQIIQIQSITLVPEFPPYAKGIINLRGSVIPVIDVRLRFGKEEIPYDDHNCIIVTSIYNRLVGFIVEKIEEVTPIPNEEISPPPKMSHDFTTTFLTGIGKHETKVILLLDTQKILSLEQMNMLGGSF